MLTTLALYVALFFSTPTTKPACETVGPRLDGTTVTICGGRVVGYAYVGPTWRVR